MARDFTMADSAGSAEGWSGNGYPTDESDAWPRLKEDEAVRLRRHERDDRHEPDEGDAVHEHETLVIGAVELDELTTVFAPPRWLRDLGRSAWLLFGVFALVAAFTWLLGDDVHHCGSGRGRDDRRDRSDAPGRHAAAPARSETSRRGDRPARALGDRRPRLRHRPRRHHVAEWGHLGSRESGRRQGRKLAEGRRRRRVRHLEREIFGRVGRPQDHRNADERGDRGHRRPGVARFRSFLPAVEPLFPVEGRPVDAHVGRPAPRAAAAGGANSDGRRDQVAAGLFPGRNPRRRIQRDRRRQSVR